MPGAHGGQKRESDPLELEMRIVVNHHVGGCSLLLAVSLALRLECWDAHLGDEDRYHHDRPNLHVLRFPILLMHGT